jgi:hypothetical protein
MQQQIEYRPYLGVETRRSDLGEEVDIVEIDRRRHALNDFFSFGRRTLERLGDQGRVDS